jgi:predicted nucleotidyltransferase
VETSQQSAIHKQHSELSSILERVLSVARERFGEDLVSAVLFGSFVRGDAHEHSDIDLLLVAENLPDDWRRRGTLELSIERLGLGLGRAIQVILVKPGELRLAVDDVAPLLLELHEAYRCLLDREGFFYGEMKRFERILAARGVRKLAEYKWEVPELATE